MKRTPSPSRGAGSRSPTAGKKPGGTGDPTYERALNLLSFRARSAHELEKRLLEKGEPAEAIPPVIARLLANGLLDDARYAEGRARVGITGKARSRRRIEQDLVHRGVDRETAGEAVRRALESEGTDEAEVALRAARKKLRSLGKHDAATKREKLYAYLARQGYPGDVVRRVSREALEEEGRE
jgi:regulatory protein